MRFVSCLIMVLLFAGIIYVAESKNFYEKDIYILQNVIYTSLDIGNLDPDPRLEIVCVGYTADATPRGFLQILELRSEGGLYVEYPGVFYTSSYVYDCTINDFNGDGINEIAVCGARLSGGLYRAFIRIVSYYNGYSEKAYDEWNVGIMFNYNAYARAVRYGNISNAGYIKKGIVVVYDGFDEQFDIPIRGARVYSYTGNALNRDTSSEIFSLFQRYVHFRYTDIEIDDVNKDGRYEIIASGNYTDEDNFVGAFVDVYAINSTGHLNHIDTNEDRYAGTNVTVASAIAVGEFEGVRRIYVSQHIFHTDQNKSFVGVAVKAFDGTYINDVTNLFWGYETKFAESVDVVIGNIDTEQNPEILVLSNAWTLTSYANIVVLRDLNSIYGYYKYQLEESTTRLMGAAPKLVDVDSNEYSEVLLCGYFSSIKGYVKVVEWDEIGPTTPIPEKPVNTWINSSSFNISWQPSSDTQSGVVGYQVQISRDANFNNIVCWINSTSNFTQQSLSEGEYFWRVRAIDATNNPSNWSIIAKFGIDTTPPPAPQPLYPQNSSVLPEVRQLRWSVCVDNLSGVKGYEVVLANDSSFSNVLLSANISNTTLNITITLSEGDYYWKVRAIDFANNVGPWSSVFTFTILSNVLPSPTLNSPLNASWYNVSKVVFDWSDISGMIKEYEIQIDRSLSFSSPQKYFVASSNLTLYNLTEGRYYWRVRGIDVNNIPGMWSDVWCFGIDLTKPYQVHLISPLNSSLMNVTMITLRWAEVQDLSGIKEYTIQLSDNAQFNNPRSYKTSNTSITLTLSTGRYYWRVRAEDLAGNVGDWSKVWTFSVDYTRPLQPVLQAPQNNSWLNNPRPRLEWRESTDDFSSIAHYHLQVSSMQDFTNLIVDEIVYSTSYSFTFNLLEGKYYWRVRAFDTAGNPSFWSSVFIFYVDTTAPSKPQLKSPQNGMYVSCPLILEWEGGEDLYSGTEKFDVEVAKDSAFSNIVIRDSTSENRYVIEKLSDGVYYWRVRARDRAGNIGEWSATNNFRIDATPPSTPLLLNPSNNFITNSTSVSLSWYASEDSGSGVNFYQLQISTTSDFSVLVRDESIRDTVFNVVLSEGTYYWRVRAVDNVGNRGEWSEIRKFRIDTTPPAVVEANPQGETVPPDSTISVVFSEEVEAESARKSITVFPLIDGDIFVEGNTIKLVPRNMLEMGREYRVSVSGVKDKAGNKMSSTFSWKFIVAAPDIEITVYFRKNNVTYVGDEISFEIILKNRGSWKAEDVRLKVYVEEVEYSEMNFGTIESGDEKKEMFKLKIDRKGSIIVKFSVLCQHDIYTGNNEKYIELEVAERPTPPPSWLWLLPIIILIIIILLVVIFWRRKTEEFPMEEKGKEAKELAKTIEKAAEEEGERGEKIEDIDLDSLFR